MLGVAGVKSGVKSFLCWRWGARARDAQDSMGLGTRERKLPAPPSWAISPLSTHATGSQIGAPEPTLAPAPTKSQRPSGQARGRAPRLGKFKPSHKYDAKWLVKRGGKASEPLVEHPIQMHAHQLYLWVNEDQRLCEAAIARGIAQRGIFAWQLKETYELMCAELWWSPHRWSGTHGVAEFFRRHTKHKKGYRYTVVDGVERRLCFYPVPEPAPVSANQTPSPTPKSRQSAIGNRQSAVRRAKGKVVDIATRRRVAA